MSKRYSKTKQSDRDCKKPKLDIVFRKIGIGNSNSSIVPTSSCISNHNNINGTGKITNQPTEDLWGDEDDDVLFQTTQMVEQTVENGQKFPSELDFSIQTFSQFRNVAQCSTQLPAPVLNPMLSDDDDVIIQMMDDDDGCDLPLATNGDVFKAPFAAGSSSKVKTNTDSEKAFWDSRIQSLTTEISGLTNDVVDYKHKLQAKENDVTILRTELHKVKQQVDILHIEKIQNRATINDQWQLKITEISKRLEATENELEMKDVEISRLKTKGLNETDLHHQSVIENIADAQMLELNSPVSFQVNSDDSDVNVPVEIFDETISEHMCKFHQGVSPEFDRLRHILSRTQCTTTSNVPSHKSSSINDCVASVKTVIQIFLKYIHRITEKGHISTLQSNFNAQTINTSYTIFQATKLYKHECIPIFRRYIGTLSILCQLLPEICDCFYNEQISYSNDLQPNVIIIDVIVDAINRLSYSNHLPAHYSTLEAFAFLLDALSRNFQSNLKQDCDRLASLVKALVFSRPNSRTLYKITQSFLNIALCNNDHLKNVFCITSSQKAFRHNSHLKTYVYTPDSCVLQVYGCMLESVFPMHHNFSSDQFRQLSGILYYHAKFLSQNFSLSIKPHWMQRVFENQENAFNSRTRDSCNCYIKICKSFVLNFYRFIKEWSTTSKSTDEDMYNIKAITNVCSRVMCQISNYSHIVYEHFINHKIFVICKMLLDNQDKLQLTPSLKKVIHKTILSNYTKETGEYNFTMGNWSKFHENHFFN